MEFEEHFWSRTCCSVGQSRHKRPEFTQEVCRSSDNALTAGLTASPLTALEPTVGLCVNVTTCPSRSNRGFQ